MKSSETEYRKQFASLVWSIRLVMAFPGSRRLVFVWCTAHATMLRRLMTTAGKGCSSNSHCRSAKATDD